MLCGLPFYAALNNRYIKKNLSNAVCASQILAENGYRNIYITGVESAFAGTDLLFLNHGFEKILDYDYFNQRYAAGKAGFARGDWDLSDDWPSGKS
ncbi:hypothetical protein FACS1894186_6260 [Alphaproteobacteria bacterium]|nr:hypothetical protein FACS1894186_6260 [Alphaproteobacteria bacterium]